jgi:hypothetical protein
MAKSVSDSLKTSTGNPVSLPPVSKAKLKTVRVSQHAPDQLLAAAHVQQQHALGNPITWYYEEYE